MQKIIKTEIYKDNNRSKQKKSIVVMETLIKYGNKQKIYFLNKNLIFQKKKKFNNTIYKKGSRRTK